MNKINILQYSIMHFLEDVLVLVSLAVKKHIHRDKYGTYVSGTEDYVCIICVRKRLEVSPERLILSGKCGWSAEE